jgi:hypothetical protein
VRQETIYTYVDSGFQMESKLWILEYLDSLKSKGRCLSVPRWHLPNRRVARSLYYKNSTLYGKYKKKAYSGQIRVFQTVLYVKLVHPPGFARVWPPPPSPSPHTKPSPDPKKQKKKGKQKRILNKWDLLHDALFPELRISAIGPVVFRSERTIIFTC